MATLQRGNRILLRAMKSTRFMSSVPDISKMNSITRYHLLRQEIDRRPLPVSTQWVVGFWKEECQSLFKHLEEHHDYTSQETIQKVEKLKNREILLWNILQKCTPEEKDIADLHQV